MNDNTASGSSTSTWWGQITGTEQTCSYCGALWHGQHTCLVATPQTTNWTYCAAHAYYYYPSAGQRCPQCAPAQTRDTMNVLEARIADLEADVIQLRARINELERYHRGVE